MHYMSKGKLIEEREECQASTEFLELAEEFGKLSRKATELEKSNCILLFDDNESSDGVVSNIIIAGDSRYITVGILTLLEQNPEIRINVLSELFVHSTSQN